MKKFMLLMVLTVLVTGSMKSQQERFGNSLNLGAGVAYYGYAPAININYEFDVFRNFTLAPFVSAMTYRRYRYWGSPSRPYRDYYYRETAVPIGVKASYYFDEWVKATDRWDFYVGTSIGVAYRSTTWEEGYEGNRVVREYVTPLYASMHIGSDATLPKDWAFILIFPPAYPLLDSASIFDHRSKKLPQAYENT